MVLHHTPNPESVFMEASRVAKEVIIIETSFTSPVNKWFTVIADAIGNLRLDAFWTSYKSDKDWQSFFGEKGFSIVNTKKYNDRNLGLLFLHIAYYLKKI